MDWSISFFLTGILLGLGLAMDAFSVSLANGLNDAGMCPARMCGIAGVFAGFQALMPLIGWLCVHTLATQFRAFEPYIPWIALILLCWIGGKMLYEGLCRREPDREAGTAPAARLTLAALLVQGVATSIDALSVGFTIAGYNWQMALVCALLIAAVTFSVCLAGLFLGKTAGTRLAGKASVFGGVILILIGLEIFLTGIL